MLRDVYYIALRPGRKDFVLEKDQFLPLGDNSPHSADARLWGRPYVERRFLIGKAFFIYWPHPWNVRNPINGRGLPVVPNFSRMGYVR